MKEDSFIVMLPYITDDLATTVAQKQHISELEAITRLYNSKLYSLLEQEETKLWHYSTDMLYCLLEQEEATGYFSFPDV